MRHEKKRTFCEKNKQGTRIGRGVGWGNRGHVPHVPAGHSLGKNVMVLMFQPYARLDALESNPAAAESELSSERP